MTAIDYTKAKTTSTNTFDIARDCKCGMSKKTKLMTPTKPNLI